MEDGFPKQRDEYTKWDRLASFLEHEGGDKVVVQRIDATKHERWGHEDGKQLWVVIEYGRNAIVLDVMPLQGRPGEESYLDVDLHCFRDGLADDNAEMFGMSRYKEWSKHYEYPQFAVLVGRPRGEK